MEEKKDEFKRPLALSGRINIKLPQIAISSASNGAAAVPPKESPRSSSNGRVEAPHPEGNRAPLSRSDASFGRSSGGSRKGSEGTSNPSSPAKLLARTASNIYSPRWILNVKRESDKQVKTFLETLTKPEIRETLSSEVRQGKKTSMSALKRVLFF